MSRKSGNKWKTNKCGRCGEPHSGYSGKLDKDNDEYVICGNRRMNIGPRGLLRGWLYPTKWEKE